jgi:phosphatidylserine/phosphatidylglycerophosphate/cardiolipin synthase-like enzyme
MALSTPGFAQLERFITGGLAPGAPPDTFTFYSPVDQVHEALVETVAAASQSIHLAMYGFDDDELATIIRNKIDEPNIFVQLSLDKSQAGGKHEKAILATADFPDTSIAIGHSEKSAIMHLKEVVIDGVDRISGSTNWSEGGESRQDNELTITRNPYLAHKAIVRMSKIHDSMLQQMAKAA